MAKTGRHKNSNRFISNKGVNPNYIYNSVDKRIITPNTKLNFGRYKGIIAKEVLIINKGYFKWLYENIPNLIIDPSLVNAN